MEQALIDLTVVQLKDMARDLGISGFGNMRKEELIEAIVVAQAGSTTATEPSADPEGSGGNGPQEPSTSDPPKDEKPPETKPGEGDPPPKDEKPKKKASPWEKKKPLTDLPPAHLEHLLFQALSILSGRGGPPHTKVAEQKAMYEGGGEDFLQQYRAGQAKKK